MSSTLGESLKLKIKYIMVNCPLHYCDPVLESKTVDQSKETPEEAVKSLKKSKFIGYTCIMITLNIMCKCRNQTLRDILKAIKGNNYLRYKTKTIQTYYKISQQFDCKREHAFHRLERFYLKYFEPLQNIPLPVLYSNFVYPDQNLIRQNINKNNKQLDEDVGQALKDHYYYNLINSDNTVLNQSFVEETSLKFKMCMTDTTFFEKEIVQMTLSAKWNIYNFYEIIQTSTNADLYFYNINPALAIIINNYYFTGPHKIREGSDLDVVHLIRELKIKQIPYILLQDCNQKQLLQFVEYLKTKDFKPLKSFLFIFMSHGNSDHIVYTHDGLKLNIMEDIVAPIQSNIYLKEIEKFLIFINCRGTKHAYRADFKQLKEIRDMLPTDATQLDRNTVLLFSVPQLVQSPRCRQKGTPFVQSLRKHLRNMQHEDDIIVFHGNIENDLKNVRYFRNLRTCSELVMNDRTNSSHIMHMPTRTLEMFELIHSLRNDFPNSTLLSPGDEVTQTGLFNIYICINKTDISQNIFLNQYSTSKLDEDHYSSDEDEDADEAQHLIVK